MRPPPPLPERDWGYFFDLDGTLLDIAPTPSEVRLEQDVHDLLTALYDFTGGAVVLISGRSIADVDAIFPERRLPVAGQHGLERRDAKGRISRHELPAAGLELARERLAAVTRRHPRLLLEDKDLSLALHYRRAPRLGGFAHRLMRSLQAELGPEFAIQGGKRVVELKPGGKDKGAAVLEFLRERPFRGRTPVFVGDDATDEYAFAVVNKLHGVSIKVGPGRTAARWRLPDVRGVRAWLASRLRTAQAARPAARSRKS